MKNFLHTFLFTISFILLGHKLVNADNHTKPLRIAALFALTGDLAPLGSEVLKGAQLALAESDESMPVELITEDVQSLVPRVAVSVAQKVISADKVDAAMTMIIEEAQPVAPLFEKAQKPLMVLWDSNRTLQKMGHFIFSNGFSTEKAGEKMAEFAFENLGLRRVAIVAHINPWAEIITPAFTDRFLKLGGEIVYSESVNPDQTDFMTVISKLKAAKPDSIYLPLVPMTSANFLKQLREQKVQLPLLGGDPIIQDVIDASSGGAEGLYQTNNWTDLAFKLSNLYRAKFKGEPIDLTLVSLGYDGFKELVAAARQANTKSISLRDALEDRFGPLRSADRVQKIFRIVNGKPSLVSENVK